MAALRSFLTSLLAFFVSLLVGSVVAQTLAVHFNGQEEWILVFMAVVVVAAGTAFVFLIVQLAAGTRRAAFITLAMLLALFAVGLGGFVYWIYASTPSDSLQGDDSPLLLGLVASTVAVILVQWLIVHWRAVPAPPTQTSPRFGRGPQPS